MQAEHEDVIFAVRCCIRFKPPPGVMQENVLDRVKSEKTVHTEWNSCKLSFVAENHIRTYIQGLKCLYFYTRSAEMLQDDCVSALWTSCSFFR